MTRPLGLTASTVGAVVGRYESLTVTGESSAIDQSTPAAAPSAAPTGPKIPPVFAPATIFAAGMYGKVIGISSIEFTMGAAPPQCPAARSSDVSGCTGGIASPGK